MRLPRHSTSAAALLATCGAIVGALAAADRVATAARSTPPTISATQPDPSRGVASATASGVVRFADLIEQERRRPRRAPAPRRPVEDEAEEERRERSRGSSAPIDGASPALAFPAPASTGPSPSPTLTFGAVQNNHPVPPDSTGAVGPTQVLTVTNHGLQAHTKSGAFLGHVSTWTFWGMFNPAWPFDPRVIFDPVHQRFIVVALDNRSNAQGGYDGSIYIAVSHTGDVLGGWTMRKFLSCVTFTPCSAATATVIDFPMVGLSANFLAMNMQWGRTYVFSYPALRQTQGPVPVTVIDPPSPSFNDSFGAPVVSASATESDLYFVKWDAPSGNYRLNRLTGPPDAPSFTPGPLVTLPSHLKQEGCVPWQGGAPQVPEAGTGNVALVSYWPGNADAVFRDDHVWFTEARRVQATDCGGHARVLWLKLHKSGTFAEGGVIEDPSGRWFMYPTIAVNRFHDVLVGFTQAVASEYFSAAFAYRAGTDPAGTMRDARVYKAGEGHFNRAYSSGVSRWGDYSHTVVDPSDDTTLWTIQEYARAPAGTGTASGQWGTWWAAVNPRGPQPPGAPHTLQATATGSSILLTWGAPTGGGAPSSYSIEAGTAPTLANLVNFPTGNTALAFAAGGVPDGTYYVRIRASNAIGTSPPSNEATLVVGCAAAPGAPPGLTIVSNSGGAVALAWQAAPGGATSYLIEAGTGPGLANLLSLDLGSANLGLAAGGVAPFTYFVRVRGVNRCGVGPASNEVVLTVS